MAMTMRMIDRLKCVTAVELQRRGERKVILEIDLRRKAVWTGSMEETEMSRSWNRFLIAEGYAWHFGSRYHLSSSFYNKCRWVIINAFFHMRAYEISEDLKGDLLEYVYNVSKRVMHLPTEEIVIQAEIEILTVFQSQSPAFNGGMTMMQPQSQVSVTRVTQLDDSLVFTGDMTLVPSEQVDGGEAVMPSESSVVVDDSVNYLDDDGMGYFDDVFTLDSVIQESMSIAEHRGFTTFPATTTAIDKLHIEKFKEGVSSDRDSNTCTICLDRLTDGVQFMRMPCMHIFHEGCIITWLNRSNSCPLCRFKLED